MTSSHFWSSNEFLVDVFSHLSGNLILWTQTLSVYLFLHILRPERISCTFQASLLVALCSHKNWFTSSCFLSFPVLLILQSVADPKHESFRRVEQNVWT